MLLPNLSELSLDDVSGKMDKSKNLPKTKPYDKPGAIVMKTFPTDELPEKSIKTFQNTGKASEAERAWLRQNYGKNWYVDEQNKQRMIKQARKALSYVFAPQIDIVLTDMENTYRLSTLPKLKQSIEDKYPMKDGKLQLDWDTEVRPRLNTEYPNGWKYKKVGGSWVFLSEEEKTERSNRVKVLLREEKAKLKDQELKEQLQKLEEDFEKEKTTVHDQMIEELNYPDKKFTRKARALCRHWFHRKGEDGLVRQWWNQDQPEMNQKRKSWATEAVKDPNYNAANPPRPPKELYLQGLDVMPMQELHDEIDAISDLGGQWLWTYMRSLEKMAFNSPASPSSDAYNARIDKASQFWTSTFREKQRMSLKEAYGEFFESMDDMSDIPNAKNVAYSYTVGSGRFNKYLLWPSEKCGGDPKNIPEQGSGVGGVAGDKNSGQIGPPDALHRLYKIFNRVPRLHEDAIVIRSVVNRAYLPHNLGRTTPNPFPEIGTGYLNVTFMSTSVANPDDYGKPPLSTFRTANCCMFVIILPKGFPVLPLVVGGVTAYDNEQEVLLPPGVLLYYQGNRPMKVAAKPELVHFYLAGLPS